ncbi:TPA: phage protein NinX family protein [Providencia alcalifaciens]
MNKYTELSDFEINKKVFISLYGESSLKDKDMLGVFNRSDYCNNPSDAMPIIIENRVAIFPIETLGVKYWCAASDFEDIGEKEIIWGMEANNKNPLRAAMETYLLMKDAGNENNNNS